MLLAMRVLNGMGINIKYQKDCKSVLILSEECRIRERSGIQYEDSSSRYRICRFIDCDAFIAVS